MINRLAPLHGFQNVSDTFANPHTAFICHSVPYTPLLYHSDTWTMPSDFNFNGDPQHSPGKGVEEIVAT